MVPIAKEISQSQTALHGSPLNMKKRNDGRAGLKVSHKGENEAKNAFS
jgi:hypothetical protein